MRRLLLLAAVVGSQLAAGCCYDRPYFPRLHSGWGCGSGTCGTPLLNRPILDLPIVDRPLLNRPILAPHGVPGSAIPGYAPGYASGAYGTPLPYYQPGAGGAVGEPGCTGCGASAGYSGGHYVGSVGIPLNGPQGYPVTPGAPVAPAPMPMQMPSAMPGGIPHDSALLKMPTIVPPGSTSKRPEELARTAGSGK